MLNPDFSPRDQFLFLCIFGVLWFAFFSRVMVFIRLERAGIDPLYPLSWSATQRRTLERIRLYFGFGLFWFWAVFSFVAPSLPTSWYFRYLEPFSMIALMAISYAWVLLLAPRNLQRLDSLPRSFPIFLAVLVLWWGTAFGLIAWMLTKATAAGPLPLIPTNIG